MSGKGKPADCGELSLFWHDNVRALIEKRRRGTSELPQPRRGRTRMGNVLSNPPPAPPPPFPPPSSPPWERREWAPPTTYSLLAIGLVSGVGHFCWVETRAGWAAFRGDRQVRAASITSSPRVSERALLLVRAAIFSWCFFILAQSAFHEGPGCLRFFTVWNFVVLTAFFGIGTGLSCTCCRHVATHGPITRDHRMWAGLHRPPFQIQPLP